MNLGAWLSELRVAGLHEFDAYLIGRSGLSARFATRRELAAWFRGFADRCADG